MNTKTVSLQTTLELQRRLRARALEHGHAMSADWVQRGHNLECICVKCGFRAGLHLPEGRTFGLALIKTCPATARRSHEKTGL
jgi:hypothetical protein